MLLSALPAIAPARTLSAGAGPARPAVRARRGAAHRHALRPGPGIAGDAPDVAALKEKAARSSAAAGHARLRKGLVVAQVALSLLLLVGAGLFVRSLWNLSSLDPGFRADSLLDLLVRPVAERLPRDRAASLYEQLHERAQRRARRARGLDVRDRRC